MKSLVDNDVALKSLMYGLSDELLGEAAVESTISVLGAAQFVLHRKVAKLPKAKANEMAVRLADFLVSSEVVEPSHQEIVLAAELEMLAQNSGLSFDIGESQLCAILISRDFDILITGDKRAIVALQTLLPLCTSLNSIKRRVKCLEQCVLSALNKEDCFERVRSTICGTVEIDKALYICFSCVSQSRDEQSTRDCLSSYIGDLRNSAPDILQL